MEATVDPSAPGKLLASNPVDGRAVQSAPLECHTDVSGHATRKIDDLVSELVPPRTQMLLPKFVDFLRHAGQRIFPAGFLLIDGTPVVRAERVWKAIDLNLSEAVLHRTLNNIRGLFYYFFVRFARWFA